uniref:Uncharacterized protein n=1 Tax=Rhizophora mucronata TaxID=61149 RepID=A0A2P2N0Z7_RHIMU
MRALLLQTSFPVCLQSLGNLVQEWTTKRWMPLFQSSGERWG